MNLWVFELVIEKKKNYECIVSQAGEMEYTYYQSHRFTHSTGQIENIENIASLLLSQVFPSAA